MDVSLFPVIISIISSIILPLLLWGIKSSHDNTTKKLDTLRDVDKDIWNKVHELERSVSDLRVHLERMISDLRVHVAENYGSKENQKNLWQKSDKLFEDLSKLSMHFSENYTTQKYSDNLKADLQKRIERIEDKSFKT